MTLRQRIVAVLEQHDALCLDDDADRDRLASALEIALGRPGVAAWEKTDKRGRRFAVEVLSEFAEGAANVDDRAACEAAATVLMEADPDAATQV